MDADNNVGRSWTFFDGPVLPDALGSSALIFSPNGTNFRGTVPNPFGGVYLLRATTAPVVPAPGASVLALGALGLTRRRSRGAAV